MESVTNGSDQCPSFRVDSPSLTQTALTSSGRYLALLLGIHIIQRGYRRLDGLVPLIPELVIDQIVVLEIWLLDIHLPLLILRFEDRVDVQQDRKSTRLNSSH